MTDATDTQEATNPTRPEPAPLVRAPLRGQVSRRGILLAGWAALAAGTAAMLGAWTRFLFPNVLFEPPQEFKAGFPAEYAVDAVDTRYKASHAVWIVREPAGFYILSTVCTHLGCTPNYLSSEEKFKCPCHGSGFVKTGINVEGPAPRPLERFKVTMAEDGQLLIDKNTKYQQEKGQWGLPGSYLEYVG